MIGKVWVLLWAVCKALFGSKQYDLLIAEYWIDAPGDMQKLLDIWVPNIGILTGIDLVHAEGLLSPDVTIVEKMKLINQCSEIAFIHQWTVNTVSDELSTEVDQLTFALRPKEAEWADIWFHHRLLQQSEDGTLQSSFDVDQETDTITHITTNLLSHADAWYLSLAVQIAQILERRLTTEVVLEKHTAINIALQPGRFSIIPWQYGSVMIDSSYNAAPKSMKKVINDVIKLRNQFYSEFDLIYVLGDMRELGAFSEQEHRRLMAQVAQSADSIFLVGPEMEQYGVDELTKLGYNQDNIIHSRSSREIWQMLYQHIQTREKRSLILFKWSQNTIFIEESIKPLLKQWAESKELLCRQDASWIKSKEKFFWK